MRARLGIDTGGTYTDAVVLKADGEVVAAGKSVTTRQDLSICISKAVGKVLDGLDVEIELVGLSTTLATNAIVEGRGGRVALLLAGFGPDLVRRAGLDSALGNDPVIYLAGGHDAHGVEREPLDEAEARQQIENVRDKVDAFAITAQFGVRNTAHEQRLGELVGELTGMPCTMGHELSAKLDAPRRALTTLLNARLIPEITRLLHATETLLSERKIDAPLMVVRGDGSLMRAETVRFRPVETILSGPAASVVGAVRLCEEGMDGHSLTEAMVADVGGTTTDIARLAGGQPRLDQSGAVVGGFRTMVEAIELRTSGLGGDSSVNRDDARKLILGPRRDMPVSLLALDHPEIIQTLEQQALRDLPRPFDARFALLSTPAQTTLSKSQLQLVHLLESGPKTLESLIEREHLDIPLKRLVERGHVLLSGFTPSDAAHVLGLQSTWPGEAAEIAAGLEGRKGWDEAPYGEDAKTFALTVLRLARKQTARALMRLASGNDAGWLDLEIVDKALEPVPFAPELFSMQLKLNVPVVAVGGPASIFYPDAVKRLSSDLIIPPNFAVCNAIGAVAGDVVRHAEVSILQIAEDQYAVQLGDFRFQSSKLEDVVEQATQHLSILVLDAFKEAGGLDAHIGLEREDKSAMLDAGREMVTEVRLKMTASGRPAIAG